VKTLEDLILHKVRISVLWVMAMVSDVASVLLYILNPAILEEFIETGAIGGVAVTPEESLVGAILFSIMLVMALLSLTLKDKVNRWSNVAVGAVFLVLWVVSLIEFLAAPVGSQILFAILGIIFFVLIIWYAYKWPKKTE
jgi:Ca2+/Na+ antiporter